MVLLCLCNVEPAFLENIMKHHELAKVPCYVLVERCRHYISYESTGFYYKLRKIGGCFTAMKLYCKT